MLISLLSLIIFLTAHSIFAAEPGDKQFLVKFLTTFPVAKDSLTLNNPQAIAINPEGQVFVVDTGNNRVIQFDQHGKFIYSVGGFGWEKEQFDQPLDISAKIGLDIFVADFNNQRIERYDKNLNYISSFYSDPLASPDLQFGFPSSVDISKHGELFICDNENNRVLKINSFGEPEFSFGDFNWGEGKLEHPVRVEVTPWDQVLVVDDATSEIVVFDYYGNFIARFGKDTLKKPRGLAIDNFKQIFVADTGNHRVVLFDRNYRVIFSWGKRGKKLGAFNQPADVALFQEKIYVLDSGNQRVQVFQVIHQPESSSLN